MLFIVVNYDTNTKIVITGNILIQIAIRNENHYNRSPKKITTMKCCYFIFIFNLHSNISDGIEIHFVKFCSFAPCETSENHHKKKNILSSISFK